MLQHCLVDLLFHGAKNIKLNNINFYLDKNPYHKNYVILKNIKHNSLKNIGCTVLQYMIGIVIFYL